MQNKKNQPSRSDIPLRLVFQFRCSGFGKIRILGDLQLIVGIQCVNLVIDLPADRTAVRGVETDHEVKPDGLLFLIHVKAVHLRHILMRRGCRIDILPHLRGNIIPGVDGIDADRGQDHMVFPVDFESDLPDQLVQLRLEQEDVGFGMTVFAQLFDSNDDHLPPSARRGLEVKNG